MVAREGVKVEVATFRSDMGYSDGRHPDAVRIASLAEEDVKRRDFTINGLVMRHNTGEILDYVDGQADLRAGIIRAIGEPDGRFAEDKLRMLRAVRFRRAVRLRNRAATMAAIRRACARDQPGVGREDPRRADETVDGGRSEKGI